MPYQQNETDTPQKPANFMHFLALYIKKNGIVALHSLMTLPPCDKATRLHFSLEN